VNNLKAEYQGVVNAAVNTRGKGCTSINICAVLKHVPVVIRSLFSTTY